MTFVCFQERASSCAVVFSIWEAFSNQLATTPLANAVGALRERQVDCVFDAIDPSIL